MTSLVLAALLLCFCLFGVGCSSKSCANSINLSCRECAAVSFEWTGDFNDCTGFVCDAFMGEDCSDTCYVAPCYSCASCIRSYTCYDCSACNMTEDLERLSKDDYEVMTDYHGQTLYDLNSFYKLTVSVSVRPYKDLQDVVAIISITDVNGNQNSYISMYIAKEIKEDQFSESATVTVTFGYPDIKDRIGVSSDKYSANIKIEAVYAKY